ncbi:hypothetical protein GR138_12905 [Shinella kummerowiae]|uniref:Uncharacterized protein n=1 Tax=Shinella kummerowiae TaxID=417745 RepID=A0A6N8SH56_9HYPH|nr:hypothetical protein [Shinella kummerowiae]MXN46090.1 hypothetical protein [Shinella kummerowiae]
MNLLAIDSPGTLWAAIGVGVMIVFYFSDKIIAALMALVRRTKAANVPVVERLSHTRSAEHPNWEILNFSVRNRDDLRWTIEALRFSSPHHCKAINQSALIDHIEGGDPNPDAVDLASLSNEVALNWELAPAGQKRPTLIAGDNDTHYLTIWVYLPRRSSEIFCSSSLILRSNPQKREMIKIEFTSPAITSI